MGGVVKTTKRHAVLLALQDEFSFAVPATGSAWESAVSRVLRSLRANGYDVKPVPK